MIKYSLLEIQQANIFMLSLEQAYEIVKCGNSFPKTFFIKKII